MEFPQEYFIHSNKFHWRGKTFDVAKEEMKDWIFMRKSLAKEIIEEDVKDWGLEICDGI